MARIITSAVMDEPRITATARLLTDLLSSDPDYRDRWRRRTVRAGSAGLNLAAVARVIAEHLWDTGERPETETTLARDIKDRVARGLTGKVLSAETLRWFTEAFRFRADHTARLWSLYTGSAANSVCGSLARPRPLIAPQLHRTLVVFEHHRIGPDRHTARHTTVHAITALTEPVDRYIHVPHAEAVQVRVERGGTLGRTLPFGPGLRALEIRLTRVMRPGEVTSLQYTTEFRNPRDTGVDEYRRFAHNRTDNVDICVTFAPSRIPRRVWWTVWDNYVGGTTVLAEPVEIDTDHTVHRFLTFVEQSVVGFRWQW